MQCKWVVGVIIECSFIYYVPGTALSSLRILSRGMNVVFEEAGGFGEGFGDDFM